MKWFKKIITAMFDEIKSSSHTAHSTQHTAHSTQHTAHSTLEPRKENNFLRIKKSCFLFLREGVGFYYIIIMTMLNSIFNPLFLTMIFSPDSLSFGFLKNKKQPISLNFHILITKSN
jgi:hypothetical protein